MSELLQTAVSWADLKSGIGSNTMYYVESNILYRIFYILNNAAVVTRIIKPTGYDDFNLTAGQQASHAANQSDFETNYKGSATQVSTVYNPEPQNVNANISGGTVEATEMIIDSINFTHQPNVASGGEVTINDYTVPTGKKLKFTGYVITGETTAFTWVEIDGSKEFPGHIGRGTRKDVLCLAQAVEYPAGTNIKIKVWHNWSANRDFWSNLLGKIENV